MGLYEPQLFTNEDGECVTLKFSSCYGTGHWASEQQAKAAYPYDFDNALEEGRCVIGTPTYNNKSQKLGINKQGMYIIFDYI